jgi:hypothetical protein
VKIRIRDKQQEAKERWTLLPLHKNICYREIDTENLFFDEDGQIQLEEIPDETIH